MAEKYKLGLSRDRLFEYNSTVVFCGSLKYEASEADIRKAVKMLACRVPAVTAAITLCDDAQAYIETDAVEVNVEYSSLTAQELTERYEKNPLTFSDKLFEFSVSSDNYLVIAGHTVFCDAKSLLRLASYLVSFYEKTELSVEPEEIYTFSEPKSLPIDVVSPIVNKLSSELDEDWQKNKTVYQLQDYEKARNDYLSGQAGVGRVSFSLSSDDVQMIRDNCKENGVDFSSAVCFGFYKAIKSMVKAERKSSKMRISADRRFFHGGKRNYTVGAYNGSVCVHLTAKEMKKPEDEQLKLFHTDVYRALTSAFRVFSDEILLHNVQESYCDSAYIYLAGGNRFKSSKNLAENYGCMNEELCEFFYCNLTQEYWHSLQLFDDILVNEPFQQHRSRLNVTVVERNEKCLCELRFDTKKVTPSQAEEICKKTEKYLLSLKK